MEKIVKRVCVMILLLSLFTAVTVGLALNVSANALFFPRYDFGTWTGSETMSVNMEFDFSRFERLNYDGDKFDPSNYTVTGTGSSTVVTLKEEYLKTLAKGTYHFTADFSAVPLKYKYGFGNMIIEGVDCTTFFKLTYGDEEVDPSNYTVNASGTSISITFKDGYLETLSGEESFYMHFNVKGFANLYLTVDVQSTSSDTSSAVSSLILSEPPPSSSPPPSSQSPKKGTVGIPKTGDQGAMSALLFLSLSAIGCIVSLITRKKKVAGIR